MSPVPRGAVRVEVTRLPSGAVEADSVASEEPLEIRIGGEPVAVTMRTPGGDEELALGFCLTEGIPATAAAVPADLAANTSRSRRRPSTGDRVQRSFYTSSSCGVCGKGALEAVAVAAPRIASQLRVPAAVVAALPDRLRRSRRPSLRRAGCTRPGSSTPPARRSASARTSAATTRWTR